MKKILDVCCGSKMFWFQKNRDDTVYMDNREVEDVLCDGRKLEIKPDIVADFRNIPFPDETFKLVVFDPPHLIKVGEKSWLAKKYGHLGNNWKEEQIKLNEILKLTDVKPLFGNKRAKTHWLVFIKERAIMIKKYVKKPVEIEAIQLTKDNIIEVLKYVGAYKYLYLEKDEDIVKRIIEKGYFEFELYDKTDIYESVGFGDFIVKDEYSEYRVFDEDEFKELYKEVR